jgi:hypothetical protein
MNRNIGNFSSDVPGHEIGGSVASVFNSRFFRGFIVFLFAGAALLVAGYGVLLLVEALNGRGSVGGNVLLFALGLILLVLSPAAFIFGIVYWTLSRPSPEGNDS